MRGIIATVFKDTFGDVSSGCAGVRGHVTEEIDAVMGRRCDKVAELAHITARIDTMKQL